MKWTGHKTPPCSTWFYFYTASKPDPKLESFLKTRILSGRQLALSLGLLEQAPYKHGSEHGGLLISPLQGGNSSWTSEVQLFSQLNSSYFIMSNFKKMNTHRLRWKKTDNLCCQCGMCGCEHLSLCGGHKPHQVSSQFCDLIAFLETGSLTESGANLIATKSYQSSCLSCHCTGPTGTCVGCLAFSCVLRSECTLTHWATSLPQTEFLLLQ